MEENWYDSYDAIKDLSEEKLEKMKIPQRLAQIILEKVSNSKGTSLQSFSKPQDHELELLFDELEKNILGVDMLQSTLNLMKMMLENIINNPKDEKFRKIKVINKAFCEKIKPFPSAIKILQHVRKIKKKTKKFLKVRFCFRQYIFLSH